MTESKRQALDWSRCAEGFADFIGSGSGVKKKADPVKRKSTEPVFGHGNIFEKLFSGIEEDKSSQSIAWSSSEEDVEEKVTPIAKKPRRKPAGKPTPPRRKSNKSSNSRLKGKSLDENVVIIDVEADKEIVPTSQPTQDGQSVKSEDLMGIGDFDSDTERDKKDDVPEVLIIENEKAGSEVASISEEVSQNSTSPITQTGTGVKGSDWVKSLQLKTPSKSENQTEKMEPEDSARKKKKHSKGGLAEQLSRLQSRDKSAVRMWHHQQGKPSASQDSKSQQLEVIGYDSLYSMQLVKCKPLSTCTSNPDSSQISSMSEPGTSQANGQTGSSYGDSRLVMFPASQSEQLNLQIGSRFKIFPPWQQLELNDGQQILLCTKYCHVIGHPETVSPNKGIAENKNETVVSAKWNCPCVQGLCRSISLCPAYQFPTVPGLIQGNTTAQIDSDAQNNSTASDLLKTPPKPSSSHLHTVSCSSDHPTKSHRSLTELTVCDSLLKSIEACRTAVDGGGDGYSGTVSFTGYIHRAVIAKENKSSGCNLLVEDKFGTVCEVQLYADTLEKQGLDVITCEHKTFQLSGLSILDRFTRDKHVGLFTMIDKVWSGKCLVESQDSHNSQDHLRNPHQLDSRIEKISTGKIAEPPGFCYILHQTDSSPVSVQPCSSNILTSSLPTYTPLSEAWKSEAMQRITCVVKLFYIYTKHSGSILYVSDDSLRSLQSYCTIKVSSSCAIPEPLLKMTDRVVLVLRDILLTQGEMHADKYSRISLLSDLPHIEPSLTQEINKLKSVNVSVLKLDKGAMENDLCTIEGQIIEVDEDAAYSWEACIYCNGEQLQGDSSQGSVQCLTCKKTMAEPVTRMKMEVVVKCDKSNMCPLVDLLQETIEGLLPSDEADEEGYELSCVLNKRLGPLHCFVVTANGDSFKLKEIQFLKSDLL